MDWKRVKTILILALIVINVLLYYSINQDKDMNETNSIDRDLVKNLLTEKQIDFTEDLFEFPNDIENLGLKLQIYDINDCREVFFAKSVYGQLNQDLLEVRVDEGKQLYFNTIHDIYDEAVMTDEAIEALAYELINELGLSTQDFRLKGIGRTGKKTILEYQQVINGHVVRDASMVIKYNNKNLLSFERVWYDVVSSDVFEKTMTTPEYALYEFVKQVHDRFPDRERAISITDLSLVYQLLQKDEVLTLRNQVVEGGTSIYWQIETSDGESYIVEAVDE